MNYKEYCSLMPLVQDLQDRTGMSKSKLIKRLIANASRQTNR
ncbi:hypothetical protein SynROS8604_03325 [Synechococcus sp. ROS8604]|nr:hypothetical protein SynROS8604_03325 [Synechococcus sp. ROS8604]